MVKLTSAFVGAVMLLATSEAAAQGVRAQRQVASRAGATVATASGAITGVVTDDAGVPIPNAIVSTAVGSRPVSTRTDVRGRFALENLPPGRYMVTARVNGFLGPAPKPVEVAPGARASSSIALRRVNILAAGLGLPLEQPAPPAAAEPTAEDDKDTSDPDQTAWRLRHARRGILKEASFTGEPSLAPEDFNQVTPYNVFAALDTAGRFATDFFTDTPFSGQVNLLTAGSFQTPRELFAQNLISRGVAFLSLSAPAGEMADWTVRAALSQADVSAWIVSGSYAARPEDPRQRGFGVSYSTQRYEGGNLLALREVTEGSRNVGEIYGYDTVAITRSVALTYGGRYSQYDYLEDPNLLSPRFELVVAPDENFRVRGVFTRRTLAPGAEEFLPPGDSGIWLPPQRTFSSLEPGRPFTAERGVHASLAVERDFDETTIAFRAFHQRINDQLLTMFGTDLPDLPSATVGHYLVGTAGDAKATGGSVAVSTSFTSRVRGSIQYSLTNARLRSAEDFSYILLMPAAAVEPERVHDVGVSLEANVPETATRLTLLYKTGNGYAHASRTVEGATETFRDLDSRFDIQVRQALPFMDFRTARWQMLVAVRNFFREQSPDQSIYDELLVVKPPKRIVGGLTMMF